MNFSSITKIVPKEWKTCYKSCVNAWSISNKPMDPLKKTQWPPAFHGPQFWTHFSIYFHCVVLSHGTTYLYKLTTMNNPPSSILCTCSNLVQKMILYKELWYTNAALSWVIEGFLQPIGNINPNIPISLTFVSCLGFTWPSDCLKSCIKVTGNDPYNHSWHKRMFLLIVVLKGTESIFM